MILVLVGCGALASTAWQGYRTAVFLAHAVHAVGAIVNPAPHPRIRFATAEGVPVEFVQNGFVSRPLGAAVPVAYDPRDPAGTVQAATFWTTWGNSLWLLPMGLGFTLFPFFGVRATWSLGR